MPIITAKDPQGSSVCYNEWNGQRFPPFRHINGDVILSNVVNLQCRDEDVMILTYPKAGTHWTWEIANMLETGFGQVSNRQKIESMIERATSETLSALPSVRLLNTHLPPDLYPTDLIERKCKIVFVQRNPKDIFVSLFYHTKKWKIYNYDGDWNGFFELLMKGESDYGSWFKWTKSWEHFISSHSDIPLLRLNFEDMKLDLPSSVEKMAQFLDIPCDPDCSEIVAKQCSFQQMKEMKQMPEDRLRQFVNGDSHPAFRKGIIGDWKTHFTVAQNERFDAEYKRQMEGYSFGFEHHLQ